MGKAVEVTGLRFGTLVVVGRSERTSSAGALWICRCDCGGETVTTSLKLRNGHTKSCGCHRRSILINYKHGHANKSRTYRTWKEMRQRCLNPKSDKWQWYGGRGITIAQEWGSYPRFLSDMGERPEGTTLDRLDSDGNYCKNNCRWATPKQQAETNRGVIAKGTVPHNATPQSLLLEIERALKSCPTVAAAARTLGISYWTVLNHKNRLKGAA